MRVIALPILVEYILVDREELLTSLHTNSPLLENFSKTIPLHVFRPTIRLHPVMAQCRFP